MLTRGLDLSSAAWSSLCVSRRRDAHARERRRAWSLWTVLIVLASAPPAALSTALLVAYGRLQPILVTLATLSIYQGLAIKVLPEPGGPIPTPTRTSLTNPNAPTGLIFIGARARRCGSCFRRTPFGVAVYALGNDEEAARARRRPRAADEGRRRTSSAGVFAAAGRALLVRDDDGRATRPRGDVFMLTSIASVVLGGVSFFGGRGSALGAIAGAFALTLVINVLFFAHIDPLYQSLFQGLFLSSAVVLGTLVGRLARGRHEREAPAPSPRCRPLRPGSPPTAGASSSRSAPPCSCSSSAASSSPASRARRASRRSS